ncbi:MAG: tetratricopeptide repeat protein [Holophagales bacterium]|nr:tetratricopeptide repeat protein [Holophagales bacterium]
MGLFSRTLSRLEELKKTLTRDPASRQFLALADEYRKQGQTREAISVLERGLAQDPTAVAGHVALGRLFQQGGRLDEALNCFQAALRIDPQNLVALRQTADVHLSRGDTVEAIKKLKLFRGLSPGDREVNELIRQMDGELASIAAPRPPTQPERGVPPPPAPELRTGGIAVSRPRPAVSVSSAPGALVSSLPVPPRLPEVLERWNEEPSAASKPPASPALPPLLESFEAVGLVETGSDAGSGGLIPEPVSLPDSQSTEAADFPTTASLEPMLSTAPVPPHRGVDGPLSLPVEGSGPVRHPEGSSVPDSGSTGVPAVTETLAELLRAQGHFGEAHAAYQELSRVEPDPARARRLLSLAEEISAFRAGTVRGRLEEWGGGFSRALGQREGDLSAVVREVVERLAPSAAVVTDFEGVPVVEAGAPAEADAMEVLSAELTAFWKNVRRSRAEIGEGALDSLVLTGTKGSVAVQSITSAYALLLKTGPGIPAGRIRFEAVRAAGRLRAALL